MFFSKEEYSDFMASLHFDWTSHRSMLHELFSALPSLNSLTGSHHHHYLGIGLAFLCLVVPRF